MNRLIVGTVAALLATGLVTSTLLNLFVVPALYLWLGLGNHGDPLPLHLDC